MGRAVSEQTRVLFSFAAIGIFVMILALEPINAKPTNVVSRQKRVSDQRLAELETLLALAKMKGKLVTVPLGFGRVDPAKIGRRRRSSTEDTLEKFRRILKIVAQDSDSLEEENDETVFSPWATPEKRRERYAEKLLF